MVDEVAGLGFVSGEQGEPLVQVGDDDEATDMAGLLTLVPSLASPKQATELARAANHFARNRRFRVIDDPKAYEAAYLELLSREDPTAPFEASRPRLCDFGVPDFNEISAPSFTGGTLVFFAEDAFLGVPYKVEMEGPLAAPAYTPLPLEPVPNVGTPQPPKPEDKLPEEPSWLASVVTSPLEAPEEDEEDLEE